MIKPYASAIRTLLAGLLLLAVAAGAAAQNLLPAREGLEFLRSMISEGRVGLQKNSPPIEPRLFTERLRDGRTVMDFVADSIGTGAGGDAAQPAVLNDWAILDEAVTLVLAEANQVKALAAQRAGTADETMLNGVRRKYLAGAARLLKFYRVAAGDVFDSTAGGFSDPFGLPDWLLPGEIQIKEIGGAGRLNTDSGDFAGRLSGTMVLPGLGAMLVVPNASFDSDGRFNLSAYGNVELPAGVLSIPARQPLHYRSTPERGQRLEGSARLTLTNGLRFDASILLADPNYCFGLAARGLEFDLGKSLLVRVPTLNLNQVNAFGDATRDAFADYFLGLNGAMETLLTAATNFPPIHETEFGQPPDFQPPQITADFSVLNAWSSEIIAKTRAGLVNAQQNLQPVLDSLAKLNADAREATNALADERFRLGQLAARFDLRRRMQEAAEQAAAQQLAGNADISRLQQELVAGARQEGSNIVALITPELLDRLAEASEVVKLLLENASAFQRLGINPPSPTLSSDPCVACRAPEALPQQRAEALALCAARRQAAGFGLNPLNGTVVNATLFNTLSEPELYRAGRLLADMEASLTLQGVSAQGQFTQLLAPILDRQRELLLQELESEASLQRTFELITLIGDNFAASQSGDVPIDNDALLARIEAAAGQRVASAEPKAIAAAKEAAQAAVAARLRQISSEVAQITGRRRSVGVIPPGDPYSPDILTQWDRFFQLIARPVPPGIASGVDAYVRFAVQELRARPFSIEFLTNRLGEAQTIASGIIGLTDWADTRLTNDFAVLDNLRFSITNFSFTFTAAAELQRGWWLIDRYQDALRQHTAVYGATVNAGLRAAEQKSRDAALVASSRISGAFITLVANIVTHADVVVPLPGNVELTRLFGRLCYNRHSGFLQGCFGGRVEFPEVNTNVFFEISRACLASDGTYSISAATTTPLPVGRMELSSTLEVAGSPAGVASFNGQGTLKIDTGGGLASGPSLTVGLGYDSAQRRMSLTTAAGQLRLSDQVALLEGSVGAEFSTASPQGALTLAGKVGLLARAPLSTNRALVPTDFWLTIDSLPTQFRFTDRDFTAEFTGGSLTLPPDLFSTNGPAGQQPVTVGITGRLCIRYDYALNRLEFCGPPGQPFTIALQNLQLRLQELPGFGLAINNATLELSGTQFPLLKNLNASLVLPLPGADAGDTNQNRSANIVITAQDWRIDGLPAAASVALGSDLRLADFDGFTFDLLSGSGLGIARTGTTGQPRITFTLTGNLRGGFDQRVLTQDTNGTAVRIAGGGSFAWDMRSLPAFTFQTLQLEGNFRLGADGPRITGIQQGGLARLSLSGLENVFQQSPENPFIIGVEGALEVPGVIKFGLLNTQFILDGSGLKFLPGGVQAELGNQSLDLVQDALPVYLRKAGLTFKNPALPLVPAVNQPGLFDLANLIVTISGGVNLPNKVAIDAGTPGFSGEVNDLAMSLRRDLQNNLQPEFNLNGLGVALQNVDIPPLGGLTGGLYVGNLNDPANLYFAGTVGGTVNDVGAEITMALHRQKGFLGACFELDVGPAGIPIDGGTLGGILLTGGKGGLSFGNEFADPCDFRTYIQFASVNGTNQPVNDGSTDGFPPTGSPPPTQIPPTPTPALNSCIVGEFPPSTINPLCERLPSNPNRIIFKGTALDAQQLAALGFTSATCPSTLEAAVAFAVGKISQPMQDVIHLLTNAVPPQVPLETRKFYTELLLKQLRQMENTARGILTTTLGDALDLNPNASLYNAIVNAAAQGIPCLDATLKLQGNFSHAAVSTVMKGEGSVTVSTTGTALMQGTVRLIGIPIGEGTLAFSLTDSQGSVNPSFGGVVHAGVGPLVLGDMSLRYECAGCFDTVIDAFGDFLQANANNLGTDVRAMLVSIMNRSVPLAQPRDPGGNLLAFYNALTPRQQMGYVVSLFNVVDVFAAGQSLQGISSQAVAGFGGAFRNFVMSVLTEVNPVFCFQAKVRPTIFGFPMIPGPTPLDARFGYARGIDPANGGDYQELSANAIFSPTFIMAALSGLPGSTLLPANDQVNFGFAFRTPAFTADRVDLLLTNPPAFFGEQASTFLQDAVMTFGYTFMPLGIPLADGQARVVTPRLASHPSNPARVGGAWQPPTGAGVAKPEDVIIAALVRGQLQNPNWRGQRGELDDLFAPFNPPPASDTPAARLAALSATINRTTMQQFSLAEDYFPHGGFIGAAQLQLPKMLASTPPVDLFGRVLNVSNPNWLADAQELFDTYLTNNAVVGQMGLYLPAPNPIGFGFATNSPQGLLDAIGRADILSIVQQTAPQGLYAFDRVLMAGWIKAQVLGLPLGEGLVVLTNSQFLARVAVSDSWLTNFIQASAEVQIRPPAILANNSLPGSSISNMYANAPRKSVQERFAERRGQLNGNPGAQFIADTVDMIESTLPKASMETAANMHIPPFLAPILKAQSGASITFFAFSPAFDPDFGLFGPGVDDDDNSPYAVAKRRGGAGVKGAFDLGLNLHDASSANDLRISIPDASFSITPDANIGLFPALNGQLKVADINLPFMPRLRNGRLNFSSSPDQLAPFIAIAGDIDPFEILIPNPFNQPIPMVQFKSRGGAGSPIGGELVVFKDNGVPIVGAGARLLIAPMRVNMPMLGPNVAMTIYGGTNGSELLPFRFSSSPGDRWSATVKIHAANNENGAPQFGICDPRQVTHDGQGNWIGSPEHCAMTFNLNAPIIGAAEGVGFETFRLAVTLPKLTNVTFFPRRDTETTLPAMGAGSSAGLIMIEKTQSDGLPRFYLDLGTNNIGLPGVLHASSRIEFGYNPTAVPGVITPTPSTLNFGTNDICGTNPAVRQITISNLSSEPANVFLSVSSPAHYTLAESQFVLGRNGGSRTVDVFFHPRTNGILNATLTIASDSDSTPTVTASLTGRGSSTARYFQSRDSIAFGDTLAGDIASGTVVVANEGCTNMVISSAGLSGPEAAFFRVTTSGSSIVGPGQSRLYRVEFAPTTLPVPPLTARPHEATLTIRTSVKTNTVALTGNSTDSRWLTLLDAQTAGSSATLNSIHMLDSKNGWAVGNSGTVLETKDGGRSWRSRILTPFNLRSVNSEAALTTPLLAAYHFEEPPDSTQFRDDGPNSFHARAEVDTATSAATNSLASGRVGGGLGFDGVDDAAYIAAELDLPSAASITMWVNPSSATASDVLLAQTDTSANATLVSVETAGTAGYRVRFGGSQSFVGGGAVTAGWQHLAVTFAFSSGLNQTTVRFYKNGTQLWTTNFTGALPTAANDIWGIGARYQTLSSRVSHFTGTMDEILFFSGVLSTTDIAALADGNGALRLMIAGDEGTLLQSETLGRVWHKAADLNVDGFRPRLDIYNDYDWLDVVVGGSFDKIVLGGARRSGLFSFGEVMVEDLFDEFPFSVIGNERYDEASFSTSPDGVFNALVRNSTGRVYAFTSGGQVFQSNGGNLTNGWARHGTLDLGQSINDATMVSVSSYVAVGNAGRVIRSVGGGDPTWVSAVTNDTIANLRGVAWVGTNLTIEPEVHAVGDGGVYLRSTDSGANWVAAADGLVGNNRSISVRPVSGTNYEAWTAGDQHRIQYRPPFPLTNGFVTFHPGELDFGMLTRGGSKTLPVEIRNRGKRDMQNVSVSVGGTGFSLVQSAGITRIAPGDAMIVQVRYKPTVAIAQALGALQITATDSGGTFTVPLIGRASDLEWQPVTISSAGVALSGEVIDLVFTTDTIGYALMSGRVMKTTDGGSNWGSVSPPFSFPILSQTFRSLDARRVGNADVLYLAGSTRSSGFPQTRGSIWRSADGGANWVTRTPPIVGIGTAHPPFGDVDIRDDNANVVACATSDPTGLGADVWQSYDGGLNWTKGSRPPDQLISSTATNDSFGGGRVVIENAFDIDVVMASDGSALYARESGGDWGYTAGLPSTGIEMMQFDPLQSIRDIQFGRAPGLSNAPITFLETGWIIGTGGLFWRWVPGPGLRYPLGDSESYWYPASDQEVFGRTDLEAMSFVRETNNLQQHVGWIVGGSKIFASRDSGASWFLDFDTGESNVVKSVFARTRTNAWAGGAIANRATVWRYRPGAIPAQGILSVNDVEIFAGALAPGATGTKAITLRNIGNAPLALQHIGFDDGESSSRFRIVGDAPTNLAVNATATLNVAFDATPDPVNVEALAPRFFHRFEHGFTDTRFFDAGALHADIQLDGARFVPTNNRPRIVFERERRDRSLRFDGNDYAEVPGISNFPGNFSVSFWVNPSTVNDGQMFVTKHGPNGENRLLIGFLNGGYHVQVIGLGFAAGDKRTGWQHIAVTGERTTTNTIVTVYRDGELLWQQGLAAFLGNASGLPWLLGAERDTATSINDFLTGSLDDVGLWDRLLTETEIQALASKSPACGEHLAKIVYQTDSESGERTTELRATVAESAGAIIIETVPAGVPVIVDGVSYPTPVTFAIGCTASTPKEWLEGSQHTIEAPASVALAAGANTLGYSFADWSLDNIDTRTVKIVARPELGRVVARYRLDEIETPGAALLSVAAGPPLIQAASVPPDLTSLVGGAPQGPWFRMTGGNITISNIGGNGFAVTGEMFASLTRIKGSLASTALNLPSGNAPVIELGAANWQLDLLAGQYFRMRARPPALTVVGRDIAPDGEFSLNFNFADASYTAGFTLLDDFRPAPNFFEVTRRGTTPAGVSATVSFPANQSPRFEMTLDGRVRVLKMPADISGEANSGWAVQRDIAFRIDTANFNLSLKTNIVGVGNWPATLFSGGPFALNTAAGDFRIVRANNGPILAILTNMSLSVNGQTAATVSGSVGNDFSLNLNGQVAANSNVRMRGNDRFRVEGRNNGPLDFKLGIAMLPPRMILDLPPARLVVAPGGNVSAVGVNVPGISFDTSGAFDTGKIPLPTGFEFDGISLNKPSNASLENNHVRLSRDADGKVEFKIRARHLFEIAGVVSCRNQLKVTIDNNVSGSYRGNFCILPGEISLGFNAGRDCQFRGSGFDHTIYFGTGCFGIKNKTTGLCSGDCPE